MASSQVEIATSSPFGCARDSCFQNNLNSHQIELWVHQPQWQAPTSSSASTAPDANSNFVDYSPPQPKDTWARAREIVRKQPPSLDISNSGGVSSLVQKWRGFEAEAKVATNKSNSPPPANEDDSIGDWESDRTLASGRSSCRGRDSDFTESERLRVADIIRRLTEDGGPYSPPRVRTSWDHQSDQQRSPLSPVIGSPRIRGRQAYIDLLTQMERDRRKELERLVGRKAVSQFSHRGRIQALFRIKFLRRGLGAIEGRFSNTTASKPPAATHLRESRNSILSEEATDKDPAAAPNEEDDAGNLMKEDECHQASATSKEDAIHHTCPEANTIPVQQNDEVLQSYPHEASPFSKFIRQDSNIDHSLDKYAEIDSEHNKEDQAIDHQVAETNYDTASDFANPQSYHEQEEEEECNDNQQVVESDAYWIRDASHPEGGWEEVQSDYQEEGVSKGDWICEVSRPRSDWEDLRQARYQEMLDPFLDNEEIRALLGRKSVSGFLSSGLREKIDQVMVYRCQTVKSNQAGEEKHVETLPEQGDAVVVSEEGEEVGEDSREGYGDYFDEFEEAESSLGQQYNESDYTDQTPASWPQNQGQESSVYSYDQVASTTPTQQSPSIGPNSSYGAHPAIEMELIYDLRRHMEQLHQEMSELRKSIKCCTDMQVKLQRSIKKEVTTALTHPDHTANGRRNPPKKGVSGGRCCVCRKMQVDCVLYRCGHMCTCFKCAHELQWSSGKCPVCRARIVDVVRTYSNY
ncbi:hypothetical protein ACS0TY_019510 [Phlomoides rotata]